MRIGSYAVRLICYLLGAYALAYVALRCSLRGEKLTILTVLRRLTPHLTPPYAGAYVKFRFFRKCLRRQLKSGNEFDKPLSLQ